MKKAPAKLHSRLWCDALKQGLNHHAANLFFVSACDLYLRKAADEGIISTGAVLCVQAVVEEASVAGGDAVQTDVELRCDAAPQVVASAGELSGESH